MSEDGAFSDGGGGAEESSAFNPALPNTRPGPPGVPTHPSGASGRSSVRVKRTLLTAAITTTLLLHAVAHIGPPAPPLHY
jgi:hypothetical protein